MHYYVESTLFFLQNKYVPAIILFDVTNDDDLLDRWQGYAPSLPKDRNNEKLERYQ